MCVLCLTSCASHQPTAVHRVGEDSRPDCMLAAKESGGWSATDLLHNHVCLKSGRDRYDGASMPAKLTMTSACWDGFSSRRVLSHLPQCRRYIVQQ